MSATATLRTGTHGTSFASKNNYSQSVRVAAQGVFPYNTAPAPPATVAVSSRAITVNDYKRTMR
jgi:hypothetical protein